MRHRLNEILLIVASFIVYFALEKLGSLFTIPFGFASLLWPVSGIMLALYLIFGRAILIGSLLASLLTIYQLSLSTPLPYYLICILAAISILQLVLSKYLILRFLIFPLNIQKPTEIIKFLLLSGPLSTLITSSLMVISLWMTLSLPTEVLCYIGASKWIGDFISIIFITPIILFISENSYVKKAKTPIPATLTSISVLSALTFIFILSSTNRYISKKQEFIHATQPFVEQVSVTQSNIKHHLSALDALFKASNNVTRADFLNFTNAIEKLDISLRALAWLPLITHENRTLFENTLKIDGFKTYQIKQLTAQGFQASPLQSHYIPISYIEPFELNQSAIGLDVSTHPAVKESVNKAINLKQHIISPLVSLVQQQNKYTGAVVYYPVYRKNHPSNTESFKGLVEAVFELDLLLSAIYEKIDSSKFTYQLLYGSGDTNVVGHTNFDTKRLFKYDVEIDLFDKKGHLTFASTKEFEQGLIDWANLAIIFTTCTIGILCVMFVSFIINFNYALTKKVEASTAQLVENNNELIVANKAKNLFLANISHEYRTPLNAIIGFTEIAQRETKDEKAIDYLSKISHSSNILLSIVNDVLDISKMQTGELNLENRSFNPAIETASVVEMLNEKAIEKSILINTDFSPSFKHWVAGDDFRFKQILINLLNNAIKFTDKGEITIQGNSTDTNNNSRIVTAVIKDTGIGMNDEQQKHIFNAFAQAEISTTRKYGGTGLGLSIVKQLCSLMKGEIKVSSQVGKGSVFTVTLELPQSEQPSEKTTDNAIAVQQSSYEEVNILVVEDNKINQIIAQKQLSSLGVTCDLAGDGQQALTYLKDNKPQLILMDLQMPVMDGFTASKLIKEDPQLNNIPIVILSASVSKKDKEIAINLGIEDFINKPFQQADLHCVLNKYFSKN